MNAAIGEASVVKNFRSRSLWVLRPCRAETHGGFCCCKKASRLPSWHPRPRMVRAIETPCT